MQFPSSKPGGGGHQPPGMQSDSPSKAWHFRPGQQSVVARQEVRMEWQAWKLSAGTMPFFLLWSDKVHHSFTHPFAEEIGDRVLC